MLQQELNINLNFEKHLKCGEIYFLANDLKFACVLCDLEIESFFKFTKHFENEHKNDFISKTEINIFQDNFKTDDDPLGWLYDKSISTNVENLKNELTESQAMQLDSNAEKVQNYNTQLAWGSYHEDSDTKSSNTNLSDHANSSVDWSKPYQPAQNVLKRPYKPRDKLNSCTYCGRTFRRRYQLDTHLNIHTGEKPNQCEICGRRFRALSTFQRHLNTHRKQRLHACQFCEKSFTHRAALLSHESRHNQKRNVSCDECEKKFYTANQYDTHKRRVHQKSNIGLPTLPFSCDICPKRYRSASMLSTHKLRKHLKSAKFACEKCDKKFVEPQKLQDHQRIYHINKTEKT